MANSFGNSQDLVAIKDIQHGTLILKDNSLRQVLMVGGLNFSLKSQAEQDMLTSAYQNFLNSMDFPLQIIIHSRKINIESYLEQLGARLAEETSPLLQSQISEYREFIRQFVQENAIMEKTFLIVVPWHPIVIPGSQQKFSIPFFGKKKEEIATSKEEDAKKRLEESLPQLAQRVDQVTKGLFSLGLEALLLNDEQLVELFYNFYNPSSMERGAVKPPESRN
jgi:type IV secretory pathway VirB4 component